MRKKVTLFLALSLVLFNLVSLVLVPKWNYPIFIENTGMNIREFETDVSEAEVFFLGDSHMEFGVSPIQIYESTGVITYNLSTSGQPLPATAFFVDEIFSKGYKPKAIIIDVDNFFIDEPFDAGYRYIIDSLSVGEDKYELIKYYFSHCDYANKGENISDRIKDLISLLFPIYKYHVRWESLSYDDFKKASNSDYFMQGFFCVPFTNASPADKNAIEDVENLVMDNKEIKRFTAFGKNANAGFGNVILGSVYNSKVSDYYIALLEHIKSVCEDNDCELVLLKIPTLVYAADNKASWTMTKHGYVKTIAEGMGVLFIDLLYDLDVGIDWQYDTCDSGVHLNYRGAEKVSAFLGKFLLDNIQVHPKDNDIYSKKARKYDKYVGLVKMVLTSDFNEYVKLINESSSNLKIFISIKDDMVANLSSKDIDALKALGLQMDFGEMNYRDSYLAVIDDGILEYEAVSNKKQFYETLAAGMPVTVTSAGYLDNAVSSIVINGSEYSVNQRGINVVVFDEESGQTVDVMAYDTCSQEHEVKHFIGNSTYEYQEWLLGRK